MTNPHDAHREFSDGQVVPGTRYRILGLIGSGGMGCVYSVEHTELGKEFVLKSLLRELASRDDLVARLRNEWRALAKLEHPNIVGVTDAGTSSSGVPFYVMERLAGETLAARIKRDKQIHPAEAARIAAEILEGLTAAHEIGIVHRDIKPPNIFLQRDGSVKVLDFGIAKIHSSAMNITGRGVAVGTPRYMSPEQARGDRVDGRADLYAVGLILFEMLTGAGPFDGAGDANDVLLAHLTRPPPQVSQLASWTPSVIDSLVSALLAKDPRQRPASARAVAQELRRFLSAPMRVVAASAAEPVAKETLKATPAQLGSPMLHPTAQDGVATRNTLPSGGVGSAPAPGSPPASELAPGSGRPAPLSDAPPSWARRGDTTHLDVEPTAPQIYPGDPHAPSRTLPEAPAFSERPPLSAGPMGTMPMSVGGQPWQRTQRLDELVDETAVPPTRTAMHAAVAPMGTPPPAEHTVAPAPRGGAGAWIAVAVGVAGLLGAVAVVGWQVMAHGNSATAQQDAAEEASPAVSAIPAVAAPSAAVEALIPSASAAPSAPPAGSAAVRPATLAGSKPVKSQPEPASTAQPTAQAPSATAAPVPVAPRPPKPAAPKSGLDVGSGL